MPCRCDRYEVTVSADHLAGLKDSVEQLKDKIEHLEGQLCNAQSLIHKLLPFVDRENVGFNPDLVKRAEEHIAVLVAHKRAEHEADLNRDRNQLSSLRSQINDIEQNRKSAVSTYDSSLAKLKKELDKLLNERSYKSTFTDKDLLG
jgi:uncharacterized phage infection (PIP) family protein YhgE